MTKLKQQYGTWPSPITPQIMAGGTRFGNVQWDDKTGGLVWLIDRHLKYQVGNDAPFELNEGDMPVRGKVGYGGGEFTVKAGFVYFVGSGGRLYRRGLTRGRAKAITPEFGGAASPAVSPDGRWIAFVHTYEHKDGIALVDSEGSMWPRKLIFGSDFYMQPAWHPEGDYLAVIQWQHPQMPWDGTELLLAKLAFDHEGVPYVESSSVIAGDTKTAIFQPEFSPDGRWLSFVSDQTGFGQLYGYDLHAKTTTQFTDAPAEHGEPAWGQGMRVYAWTKDSQKVYFLRNTKGVYSVHCYDVAARTEKHLEMLAHYTSAGQITVGENDQLAFIGASSKIPARLVTYSTEEGERIYERGGIENLSPEQLADAEAVEWTGEDGDTVYGMYYAPANDRYEGTGQPPLMILVHGGPTSQRAKFYDSEAQFFATRGFAVLQVNYRGSTGYGREYMKKLRGNWGDYDVQDAISGAKYLINQGLADAGKVVICGGSAGGYTVLQALVDYPGFFKAGICKYGIANQFMLVQDTHKFEERYNDSLIGPLPEAADLYRQRSPIYRAKNITDPVIIFQGEDDVVVPKNQSDSIVEALKANGTIHEYHVYEGEGHGFRKPENIKDYYKRVMKFLTQYVIYA